MCDKTEEPDQRKHREEDSSQQPARGQRKTIKERIQEIRARDAEEVIDENGNDIRIVSVRA